MDADLDLALRLADMADSVTLPMWSSGGVEHRMKHDGSPVTDADVAAERAVIESLRQERQGDAFIGEEIGEGPGTTGRRWIVDGIDGTRFFAAGAETWGTLVALQVGDEITLGVASSPAQNRRWWASKGQGAFTTVGQGSPTQIRVSTNAELSLDALACLPRYEALAARRKQILHHLGGEPVADCPWSHQNRVAEGQLAACIWFGGDIWDHAAPSIIVEEAGGRFTDHWGRRRLDTRTAVYSNGVSHDRILRALATTH